METTRRGFFGLLAGVVAAAVSVKAAAPVEWKTRWWSAPGATGRLYFSKVHDPASWDLVADQALTDTNVWYLKGKTLYVHEDLYPVARRLREGHA